MCIYIKAVVAIAANNKINCDNTTKYFLNTRVMCWRQHSCFIIWRSRVKILALAPPNPSQVCPGISQSVHTHVAIVCQSYHCRSLPHPFHFVIQQSCHHGRYVANFVVWATERQLCKSTLQPATSAHTLLCTVLYGQGQTYRYNSP